VKKAGLIGRMLLLFLGRRCACLALLALVAGCGSPALPELSGTLVGESAHFRLFIDPDYDTSTLPDVLQGTGDLDWLESDWADKQTMLKMPEGQRKIDYHLMTPEHAAAACEGSDSCELGSMLEIATSAPYFQHELIHAYMQLAAPGAEPIGFIAEGTAQAIGCYALPWKVDPRTDASSWQQAITSGRYDYGEGGVFARYLIRTQGIDAFVRYYRQAPQRRDPALFAANFSAFWNVSIDDAWAAMHAARRVTGYDAPICPCSFPTPATDGQPLDNNLLTHPYWPLPDTGGASLALTAPTAEYFDFSDCEGVAPYIESNYAEIQLADFVPPLTDVAVAIVQLPSDGRRRYTTTPLTTASVGAYIADSCGGGVAYTLPEDFVAGSGGLSVIVDQATIGGVTKYAQVQLSSSGIVGAILGLTADVDVCGSCGFDQGSCVADPVPGGFTPFTAFVRPGPVNVRWNVPPVSPGGAFPDPAGTLIQVTGLAK
jgi:hypothetical protein